MLYFYKQWNLSSINMSIFVSLNDTKIICMYTYGEKSNRKAQIE